MAILKSSNPHCKLFSLQEGKMGTRGKPPKKHFGTVPFQSKENALFDIERALSFF